jgi:hypothetical protein
MSRKTILACVVVLLSSVSARAEESSSEEAPFAGGGNKTAPAPFAASPSAGFAALGQWVLSLRTTDDGGGYVFFHKASGGDWQLSLHPSIDYFITSSVSIGATFGYFYSPAETGTTVFSLGGRAGFNLNINDNVGFWPSAGVGVNIDSRNHDTNTSASLGVFAPFLYHLVPHLFVGVGPSFSVHLDDGNGKTYGLDFVLGGWL